MGEQRPIDQWDPAGRALNNRPPKLPDLNRQRAGTEYRHEDLQHVMAEHRDHVLDGSARHE
jgi:hypothetical protein